MAVRAVKSVWKYLGSNNESFRKVEAKLLVKLILLTLEFREFGFSHGNRPA